MTCSTSDLIGPLSTKFFTKTWLPSGPPKAALLFIHGFVEHIQRYDHVFPLYAAQGIAVFAFDQRGFGQTAFYTPKHTQGQTSWDKQFKDIDFFSQHVRSTFGQQIPLFLMGHSMGGGLVLGYPTRSPLSPTFTSTNFSGIIATSPLLRQAPGVKAPSIILSIGSMIGKIAPNLPINAKVKPEDTCRDPLVQKAYAQDKLCKQQGSFGGVGSMLVGGEGLCKEDWKRWPKDTPLLIAHGESDKVTDHKASEEFVRNVGGLGVKAEYKGFPGFYHEMQNEPGEDKFEFINFVIDWILRQVSSQPQSTSTLTDALPQSQQPPTTTASGAPTIEVSPASPVVVNPGEEGRESKL